MMNERTKEIAEQAGSYAYEQEELHGVLYIEAFKEKFAELLVKECVQVMKSEGEQFSLDQNFDAVKGVGRCMRRVKEHFGVTDDAS